MPVPRGSRGLMTSSKINLIKLHCLRLSHAVFIQAILIKYMPAFYLPMLTRVLNNLFWYWKILSIFQYFSTKFRIIRFSIDISITSVKNISISMQRIKRYFSVPKYWNTDHWIVLTLHFKKICRTLKLQKNSDLDKLK